MKKVKNMDVEQNYTGNDGPEHWHTLYDRFAGGAKFAYQSPTALERESAETVSSQVTFHYKKKEFTKKEFKDAFHFISSDTKSYVMLGNVVYRLTDIHFHMPSEHLLPGKQYPLEFHLVHMNDVGGNLAVGCLSTVAEEENRFSEASHPMDWGSDTYQQWFNPSILLPGERLYHHYVGSLTTPPTKGPMEQFVFDIIQKTDRAFLNKIREGMLAFNNRSLQLLNGRKIYFSND